MSQIASAQPASRRSVCSGARGRGEVEVVVQPTEHRVADRPADQRELVAGRGEAGAEVVDDRRDPVQLVADAALDLDDRERRAGRRRTRQAILGRGPGGPSQAATRVGPCPARRCCRAALAGVRGHCSALGPLRGPAADGRAPRPLRATDRGAARRAPSTRSAPCSRARGRRDQRHGHQRRRRAPGPRSTCYPFSSADAHHQRRAARRGRRGTDAATYVGTRMTDPGPYETVDELAPGETVQYSVSVPRGLASPARPGRLLDRRPRARRRLRAAATTSRRRPRPHLHPLVPATPRGSSRGRRLVILPIRHGSAHDTDGRVGGPRRLDPPLWPRAAASRDPGRLRRRGRRPPADLAGGPGGHVDAVVRLSRRQPGPLPRHRPLDPTAGGDPDRRARPTRDRRTPPERADPGRDAAEDTETAEDADLARRDRRRGVRLARRGCTPALEGSEVLALPVRRPRRLRPRPRHEPDALRRGARKRTGTELAPWACAVTRGRVAPPATCSARRRSLIDGPDDARSCVGDNDVPTVAAPLGAPTRRAHARRDLVRGGRAGGPGPGDPMTRSPCGSGSSARRRCAC